MPESAASAEFGQTPSNAEFSLSRADLAATLNAVTDAITVQRPDGALVWANPAAARLLGYKTPEEMIAAPVSAVMERFTIMDEEGKPFPADLLPSRRALLGEQPPETLLRWKAVGSDRIRWSLVRSTPVFGEDGKVRFAVNLFRDATAHQAAIRSLQKSESRLAILATASRAILGAALDPLEIAERLTEVCVPTLGDLCGVWEIHAGQPRRIADRVQGAPQSWFELEGPSRAVKRALKGESTLVDGQEQPDHRSFVVVPIPGRSGPLGVILLGRNDMRTPLSAKEVELVSEVGRRAGAAIENALLYAERSRAAQVLSRSLVPAELADVPGLDVHGFVRAAASGVGGDFYDVVSLADGRSLLVIADVCGKGPDAAALTAMTRYTLCTLSRYYASPAELLRAVNETLVDQLPDGRFCSLACGAFGPSPEGIRISVAVAGHPKPIIVRASGKVENCGETGFPLGIFYRLDLEERDVVLQAGDSFLLVTDGCVGEGGAWESALHAALSATPSGSAAETAALVEKVALGVQPDHPDDIAALVARYPGTS